MPGSRRPFSLVLLVALALAPLATGCLATRNGTDPDRSNPGDSAGTPSSTGPNAGTGDPIAQQPTTPPKPPTRDELSGFGTELSDEVPAKSITSLKIRAGRGSIQIIGDPDARKLTATASIQSWAERLSEAKRIAHEIRVEFDSRETENPSLIVAEPQMSGYQDYECNLVIRVPSSVRVTVENYGGNAEVAGLMAGLTVVHRGGDLTINNVQGGVEVENFGTSCTMEQLTGKVTVTDADGALRVGFVTGEVVITDTVGELVVHSVDGNVTARNNPGEPRFFSIEGDLTLVGISHNKAQVQAVSGSVVYPSAGH